MAYRDDEFSALRARIERLEEDVRNHEARIDRQARAEWVRRFGYWMRGLALLTLLVGLAIWIIGGIRSCVVEDAREERHRCERVCAVRDLRFEWVGSLERCICSGGGTMRAFTPYGIELPLEGTR